MKGSFFLAGILTGALGDVGLQISEELGFGNRGLEGYFLYQGRGISVLKAAGLTGFWSGIYGDLGIFGVPTLGNFMLFAGVLDLFYRWLYPCLYPSLDGYYQENSWQATVLYNAITAALVWGVRLLF